MHETKETSHAIFPLADFCGCQCLHKIRTLTSARGFTVIQLARR